MWSGHRLTKRPLKLGMRFTDLLLETAKHRAGAVDWQMARAKSWEDTAHSKMSEPLEEADARRLSLAVVPCH
jgi:hypothetical protein